MAIHLTQAAIERVQSFLAGKPGGVMRFGVKKTGCSGWGYVVELIDSASPSDHVFTLEQGIKVVVDQASLALVDGTTIDCVRSAFGSEFVFQNPNMKAACGCGVSFTV
jgi:iron-sulfur cluster assembly protein